jgi:hypothetical protein
VKKVSRSAALGHRTLFFWLTHARFERTRWPPVSVSPFEPPSPLSCSEIWRLWPPLLTSPAPADLG